MKGTLAFLLLTVALCQGAIIREKCSDSRYQLFAHENCNQYYQCVNDELIVRDCPPSLYFNPEIQSCDWRANVNCGRDEDSEGPDNSNKSCRSGHAEGQFFVHENCDQYYWCVHGNQIELSCNQGLLFNHETLQCDWSQNVVCKTVTQFPDTETPDLTEIPTTESEIPDINVTPSPDNSCEDDNEDDNDESVSDESVSDQSDSYESDSDEDGQSEETSDEKPVDVDTSDENDSNQDSSEENGGDSDSEEDDSYEADVNKVCAVEGSDGVLIAHEDCSKFYKCAGGKPVVMSCPSDLLFDSETEQCDWPQNVECGKYGKLYLKKKLEVTVDVLVRGKQYA